MIPKINSAHGSDTRNLINRAIEVLNQQGKTIQDLVAEGQLTPTQYAELITVINGLIKSGYVDKSDLTSEFKDEIEGFNTQLAQKADKTEVNKKRDNSVPIGLNDVGGDLITAIENKTGETTFSLLSIPRNNSVTKEMVAFLNKSSNLFDLSTALNGKRITFSTGEIVDQPEYTTTDFISVEPDSEYISKGFNQVVYYDESKKRVSALSNPTTFTTPENGFYIRLHGFTSGMETAQVNRGSELLPYEPYYAYFDDNILHDLGGEKIKKASIGIDHTNFIETSSNLFNSNTLVGGHAIISSTGELEPTSGYSAMKDFITVEPGQIYSTKGFNRVAFYDAEGNYTRHNDIENKQDNRFTPRSGERYVRLHLLNSDLVAPQINVGDGLLPYEPYYLKIDGLESGTGSSDSNDTFYFPPQSFVGEFVASDQTYTRLNLSELYAGYDTLREMDPDYFKQTNWGKDSSGEYDVWEYNLKPTGIQSNMPPIPKIIFNLNVHGEEKAATFACYYFIKEMMENWQSNPILEYIRWNVELAFIPVLNPWGFVNENYKNYNGVNIQVNLPEKWSSDGNRGDPTSNLYAGPAPLSEVESQYVKEFIDKHEGALQYIDFHTQNAVEGDDIITGRSLVYHLLENGEHYNRDIEVIAKYVQDRTTRWIQTEYGVTAGPIGMIQRRSGQGALSTYAESVGIPSVIQEHFYKFPGETGFYSSDALKGNIEFFASWLVASIKHFREKYYMR